MKKIARIVIPLAALVLAALLPFPYIFQGPLVDVVGRTLRVKIDPRFSGGEVLAKFLDPMDDDRGEGALTYPDLPAFQGKKYLDIVKYTVHQPVLNSGGGETPDFWQMDVTFADVGNPLNAPLGFSHPVIHIYIDIDGKEGGSTQTARPDAELVSFDPSHPWDFMIHVDGFAGDGKGYIVSYDQAYKRAVQVFFVEDTKTVYARVELDDARIKRILDERPTFHYVVVGAFDPISAGGFMSVLENSGPRNGGGARSSLTPRIFDWVEPEGAGQDRYLSSYDQTSGAYATVVPIEVKRGIKESDSSRKEGDKSAAEQLVIYREKLRLEQSEVRPVDYAAGVRQLLAKGVGGMELVEAYYQAQMFEQAEEASRRILEISPGHAGAALYLAMAASGQSGQQKSPMKAMDLVNKAFALYEKALPLCKTPEERLNLYLQRGRYAAAVPEAIFRKSAAAAADFLNAAAIVKNQPSSPQQSSLLADCFINAAKAFARSGNADEAEIYFHKAAEFKDLTTAQIVVLLEHGLVMEGRSKQR
jgi:tetratricopeptide (TPR) repeat protein